MNNVNKYQITIEYKRLNFADKFFFFLEHPVIEYNWQSGPAVESQTKGVLQGCTNLPTAIQFTASCLTTKSCPSAINTTISDGSQTSVPSFHHKQTTKTKKKYKA